VFIYLNNFVHLFFLDVFCYIVLVLSFHVVLCDLITLFRVLLTFVLDVCLFYDLHLFIDFVLYLRCVFLVYVMFVCVVFICLVCTFISFYSLCFICVCDLLL